MSGYSEREIIGALLKGGSLMFGKRVELTWPDGQPRGMDEDTLHRIGEQWAPLADRPQWARADAAYCTVRVPCAHVLTNGECEWHGRPAAEIPVRQRPDPGRLRYLAAKLTEGGHETAVALALHVLADELTEESRPQVPPAPRRGT
jgi:hypothetical protein